MSIVNEYYELTCCTRTGVNNTLQCIKRKFKRKLGIEYELYRNDGEDPNRYMLNSDQNYNKVRVRKFTVYNDKNGNLIEYVENDFPIDPNSLSNVNNINNIRSPWRSDYI